MIQSDKTNKQIDNKQQQSPQKSIKQTNSRKKIIFITHSNILATLKLEHHSPLIRSRFEVEENLISKPFYDFPTKQQITNIFRFH